MSVFIVLFLSESWVCCGVIITSTSLFVDVGRVGGRGSIFYVIAVISVISCHIAGRRFLLLRQ